MLSQQRADALMAMPKYVPLGAIIWATHRRDHHSLKASAKSVDDSESFTLKGDYYPENGIYKLEFFYKESQYLRRMENSGAHKNWHICEEFADEFVGKYHLHLYTEHRIRQDRCAEPLNHLEMELAGIVPASEYFARHCNITGSGAEVFYQMRSYYQNRKRRR